MVVAHYSYITPVLVDASYHARSRIANSIVHISVQLLSPPVLATKMVTEYKLLYSVFASLGYLLSCASKGKISALTDVKYFSAGP